MPRLVSHLDTRSDAYIDNAAHMGELVGGLRAELDRRLRSETRGWWAYALPGILFHWQFVGWRLPSGPVLAFELLYLALIPLAIVRYRRAKRERALLG